MHLFSPNVGWALRLQRLYRTNTAGANWSSITPANLASKNESLDGAFFLNENCGWLLVARAADPYIVGLALASTQDAGKTWSYWPIAALTRLDREGYGGSASIFFVDPLHGWIMLRMQSSSAFSFGSLYATSDGGKSWVRLPSPPIGDPARFVTTTDGWLAGGALGDELYVTRDAGRSWQPLSLPAPEAAAEKRIPRYDLPTFVGSKDGTLPVTWTTANNSFLAVYRTHDGGRTWRMDEVHSIGRFLHRKIATCVLGSTVYWALNSGNGIIVAVAGSPAVTAHGPERLSDVIEIDLVNPHQGWLTILDGDSSTLWATSDGGTTLTNITPK